MIKNILSILLFGVALQSAQAHENLLTVADAINISGKEGMLAQRIAKAYLFKTFGTDPLQADKEINTSLILFDENLRLLKEFALSPELVASMEKIETTSKEFKDLASHVTNKEGAIKMLSMNTAILEACTKLQESLITYALTLPGKGLAQDVREQWYDLIRQSGKQRMLSQRGALYYAAYYWNLDNTNSKIEFEKAITDFQQTLSVLLTSTINTPEIDALLSPAIEEWKVVRESYNKCITKELTPETLLKSSTAILSFMDKCTGAYAQLYPN